MPFVSEKQRRFMWKHHPKIAKKWAHKYGSKPKKGGKRGKKK
jgi:hypothetical protein